MAFTYKEKLKAIKHYQNTNSIKGTVRELGYPSRGALKNWIKEFNLTGTIHGGKKSRYSPQQREAAVQYYLINWKSVEKTIKALGYTSDRELLRWLRQQKILQPANCFSKPVEPYPSDIKKQAVSLMRRPKSNISQIARQFGVSRRTLYAWDKEFPRLLTKDIEMPPKERHRAPAAAAEGPAHKPDLDQALKKIEALEKQIEALSLESEQLQREIYTLRLQKDVMKETAKTLKMTECQWPGL